ncbi:MAG: orotidine-5'-phosphate decarboxylase, partial [Deltaproteobacteria bacterium]|nr:orotidine-5'-phosphate decarboxylase [Deltaproteobacteria bacterium]
GMAAIHPAGGARMLEGAAKARDASGAGIKLLGVTVLTSMDDGDLEQTGCETPVERLVLKRALLARGCGLDGVIASPLEISLIRGECPKPFLIVTPGIRPSSGAGDDQKRVATPESAVKNGADYIVVGRPVLNAADPAKAAETINSEIMSL